LVLRGEEWQRENRRDPITPCPLPALPIVYWNVEEWVYQTMKRIQVKGRNQRPELRMPTSGGIGWAKLDYGVMQTNEGKRRHDASPQKGIVRSRWIRTILIIVGTASLMTGIVGIFLPILPTTPLLLLTAICYGRGSQRFYDWLLNNKVFGDYIRNYREGKGISFRVKALTLSLLWITITLSAISVGFLFVQITLLVIALGVTAHLLSLPTLRR